MATQGAGGVAAANGPRRGAARAATHPCPARMPGAESRAAGDRWFGSPSAARSAALPGRAVRPRCCPLPAARLPVHGAAADSGSWWGRPDAPRPRTLPGLGCHGALRPSRPPPAVKPTLCGASRRSLLPSRRGALARSRGSRCRSRRRRPPSAPPFPDQRISPRGRTARRRAREGEKRRGSYLRAAATRRLVRRRPAVPGRRRWLAVPEWRPPGCGRGETSSELPSHTAEALGSCQEGSQQIS